MGECCYALFTGIVWRDSAAASFHERGECEAKWEGEALNKGYPKWLDRVKQELENAIAGIDKMHCLGK